MPRLQEAKFSLIQAYLNSYQHDKGPLKNVHNYILPCIFIVKI